MNKGEVIELQNPSSLPEPTLINYIEEPWIKATIITPDQYLGAIIKVCQDKRGVQTNLSYSGNRAVLNYEIPLNEVVFDFNDRLKSMTSGYASFDYEIIDHREGDLVKLGILVNSEPVDALAMITHRANSAPRGRMLVDKLKELIHRQMFDIAIQAAIGSKIIARESVKALRKNVLAKCYGGDITRKRKLLEKQKAGKKKMKLVGRVEVPQEAFLAVLRTDGK
jgi:GTP-binding protein LepA